MTFRVAFPTASRRKNVRACHSRFADQRVPRSINVLTEMGLENLQSHLSQTLSIQAAYAPLIFLSLSAIIRPPHTLDNNTRRLGDALFETRQYVNIEQSHNDRQTLNWNWLNHH